MMAGQQKIVDVIDRIMDGNGTVNEKLLAMIRVRHSGNGSLRTKTQMALASISPSTYKRISRRADELIRAAGYEMPKSLSRLPEMPGGLPPLIKSKIPQKLRWQVFRRDGYACKFCGEIEDLTVDHIESEKSGGEATFDNLQTLCRPCNSAKGVK